jgi:hypothetical protein
MNRSKTPSFANPFLLWTGIAWKTGEMMLASAQVIHHRLGRIAAAGPTPNARDRRELALMTQEKMEAAIESAYAVATQMVAMNPLLGAQVAAHMMRGATAVMSLAASRTAGQAIARQAKLIRTMMEAAPAATQLSGAAARVVRRGLNPIHSRATENAKRLSSKR